MCDHCGCRGVPAIAELMGEHDILLDDCDGVRRALRTGDAERVMSRLRLLVAHLEPHVRREELGIFTVLREQGDWTAEVVELEQEHLDLDAAIAALDQAGPDFDRNVLHLLHELAEHVQRENLGIFPVSVVTLGAVGWNQVQQAQDEIPTFLTTI